MTGQVPETMKKSEFILIPKKKEAVVCNKHRTNSFMSQIGEIIMKVLTGRVMRKMEETVGDGQFCIGNRMGIRSATFMLRMIMEKTD